jgi:hypothetical protein
VWQSIEKNSKVEILTVSAALSFLPQQVSDQNFNDAWPRLLTLSTGNSMKPGLGCTRTKQHDGWTTETEPAGHSVP